MSLPQPRRVKQRSPYELSRPRNRLGQRHPLSQPGRDRAGEGASRAMIVDGVDPLTLPALRLTAIEQQIGELAGHHTRPRRQ